MSNNEIKEVNEVLEEQIEVKPSVLQRFGSYMKFILNEMVSTLKMREFSFERSGIIISIILVLISLGLSIIPYFFDGQILIGDIILPFNPIGIPIGLLIAFIVIFLWFMVGYKVTPKAAHVLVDNKIVKLIFTKGHVHYLEYIPDEKRKIAMPHILNKYIALLIAWMSVSAFFISIFAGLLSKRVQDIVNPGDDIFLFLVRTLIIFVLVPLIFTLIYPLAWMLIDSKLKSYNKFTKLNSLVGAKVSAITTGFITMGALIGLGADALAGNPIGRVQLIVNLLLFCIINISLTVICVAIFYNIFFQGKFYNDIIEGIDIGFGITSVAPVDKDGNPIQEEEKLLEENETEPKKSEAVDDKYEPETVVEELENQKSNFCPSCGKELDGDFCKECGSEVKEE